MKEPAETKQPPFIRFFKRLEALRRRMNMKGVEFTPAHAVVRAVEVFSPRSRRNPSHRKP
jgi:hypothetical protein